MSRQGNIANEYRKQLLRQAGEAAAVAERNRLARDLHDSIKQQIFSIRMSAIAAQAQIESNAPKAREALADIQQSAQEALVEMQALLHQLRPAALEHTNFAEAVRTQAQALEYRSGVCVRMELAELAAPDRCPPSMQEAVFRVVQEAFTNVARHARAGQVECAITHDDQTLDVLIRDDGQGFDPQDAARGMGLASIRERVNSLGGSVKIESAPGKGTTLRATIPLLLPAEMKQQQEQQEQKAKDQVAQVRSSLQLRSSMAIFTMLVMLIDIDLGLFMTGAPQARKEVALLILCFCLSLMFYSLIRARVANIRLMAYRGKKDRETCALRLQEHQGWGASLRLALFSAWHLVFWGWHLLRGAIDWQVEGLFLLAAGLLLVFVLFLQRRTKRAQDACYSLLTYRELQGVLRQRVKTLRLRVILVLCVALSLVVNGPLILFTPVLLWRLLAASFLFAFIIQCLCLVIDTWQLRPWRKALLAEREESASGDGEGGMHE